MLKEYKMTEIGILPVDWKIRKIRDLFKVTAGGDINQAKFKKQVDRNHIYPVYSNALSNRGIYGYYSTFEYDGEHITITARGDVGHAQNRSGRFVAVGRVLVLKANEIIDYKYFADFINYSVKFHVESTGVPQLTAPQAASHFVAVPPLPEQQKIADILTTVDAHISETEVLIEKIKVLKQGLMQQLLTKGIGHTEFKDTEIGRIPVKWEVLSTEQIVSDAKGSLKIGPFGSQLKKEFLQESGQYRVYGQENVFTNDFTIGSRYISREMFDKLNSCKLSGGEIVISMMGTIGKCAIVPYDIQSGIMDSHLIRIRLNANKADSYYIKYVIAESYDIQNQIKSLSVGGIMAGLSSGTIRKLNFPIPPLSEQCKIAAILTSVDNQIDTYQAKLTSLTRLKTGLMQQLLTGKIRVKV